MSHQLFMQRCLEIARNGIATTSPNPMVGAVIVHEGKIIGEGWHRKSGTPHAEAHAINSVKDKSLLKESTIYVSLEPCSHFGKTPPCADLIIESNIPKVVIGMEDPNPMVSGKGIKKLKDRGITVESGILEDAAKYLNRKFIKNQVSELPYITLKWAQSQDGFIDIHRPKGQKGSYPISSPETRSLVHKWRSENDAILIGVNTANTDNPSLNTRDWSGASPQILVLDPNNRIEKTLNVFERQPFVYTKESGTLEEWLKMLKREKGIQSILVEGGAFTLNFFIENKLADEALRIVASKKINQGLAAPKFKGALHSAEAFGEDKIERFFL